MSTFADIVRTRVSQAVSTGRIGNPARPGGRRTKAVLSAGSQLLGRLMQQNAACAANPDCTSTMQVLSVAGGGTDADARTALTRLQILLTSLTAADADVAADNHVQSFRQGLHLALDH